MQLGQFFGTMHHGTRCRVVSSTILCHETWLICNVKANPLGRVIMIYQTFDGSTRKTQLNCQLETEATVNADNLE